MTKNEVIAIIPKTTQEVLQLSEILKGSTAIPKAYAMNPKNIPVAIMHGMEIGLTPLQALNSIVVINGNPIVYGHAPLALVKRSGELEYIKEKVKDTQEGLTAICEVKRKGEEFIVTSTFSMADAQTAGLTEDLKDGSAWKKYPKRMLQMRARATCLKDAFPDVLLGIHIDNHHNEVEEVIDATANKVEVNTVAKQVVEPQLPPKVSYNVQLSDLEAAILTSEEFFAFLINRTCTYDKDFISKNKAEIVRWASDNLKFAKYYKDNKGDMTKVNHSKIIEEIKEKFEIDIVTINE